MKPIAQPMFDYAYSKYLFDLRVISRSHIHHAMLKMAFSNVWSDCACSCLKDSLSKFSRCLGFAEIVFSLEGLLEDRKGKFDWIKIRGIGRQVLKLAAVTFNEWPDILLPSVEIIERLTL
jgi:hypothetical protein